MSLVFNCPVLLNEAMNNLVGDNYELKLADGYIEARMWGKLEIGSMKTATAAVLEFSRDSGVRRILYDASQLEHSDSHQRSEEVKYAKQVRDNMDKMATYVPGGLTYYTAKIIYRLAGIKNAQAFRNRDKAIAWLKTD